MTRANPLHPDQMSQHERRNELYNLLGRAVLRVKTSMRDDPSQNSEESSLHFSPKQSGTVTPTQRRST